MKTLRLVLGDQLNAAHPWFKEASDEVVYLMAEMRQETDYAPHHIQKVLAFFAAMRAFADARRAEGHRVVYLALDDGRNTQGLEANVRMVMAEEGCQRFEYQWPDEYRLDAQLKALAAEFGDRANAVDTHHFLTARGDLAEQFKGKKTYLMESFYRRMRKAHGVLMEGGAGGEEPAGGKWNYDATNRKKLPKGHRPVEPLLFERDLSGLEAMLQECGVETIGSVDAQRFLWPVTRQEGLQLLDFFVEECLPRFGDFQDAMHPEYWSMYHARISFCMNAKLISPMEVIRAVEDKWRADPDHADITQVEGFIRQILGWREYMRGVYWAHMPEYAGLNFFEADNALPAWFWTGETKMACLRHAIDQSLQYSYAHHIQRLMVTGNFALLAGIHPDEVDRWYLGIYIDAIEWVEITNTRGMSQFADGGIVGTKPYGASANYMKKMGPYCSGCRYDAADKTGDNACPLNSLYWHFHVRNRAKLERNPRIGMAYRTWDKMPAEKQQALLDRGDAVLANLENL
ncbi:MAG: cryptochrome/photolyase family protein [Flavobacteriales bacterium]|nr:cryptochrome/photolyase family protein [Flavobacteriales bacterium]